MVVHRSWRRLLALLPGIVVILVLVGILFPLIPNTAVQASPASGRWHAWPAPVDLTSVQKTSYPVPSDAYFVAPDGTDGADGKENSPWLTLQHAIATVPDSSTIVLRAGTYRIDTIIFSKRLTLQSYPNEEVWLKGSRVIDGWVQDGTTWRKDGWISDFPPISSVPGAGAGCPTNNPRCVLDPRYPEADYRDMVFVDNVALKQVLRREDVTTSSFYIDTELNQLIMGVDPTGKTVEASTTLFGLEPSRAADGPGAAYSIIRGLGFAHFGDTAVRVNAPFVTLEKNTFTWNGVVGVGLNGNAGGTDGVARNNVFSYNGRKGLSGGRPHRWVIEKNVVSQNNVEHFRLEWDAAGMKFVRADAMIVRQNRVEDNLATGIWLDVNITNVTITENFSRRNQAIGIFFEVSRGAVIASNVSIENEAGIMLNNSADARIYNNMLLNNRTALRIMDTARVNTVPEEVANGLDWEARGNVIKNNVLAVTNASNAVRLLEIRQTTCGGQPDPLKVCNPEEAMIAELDYNIYFRSDVHVPSTLVHWQPTGSSPEALYTNLADFKAATDYENHSLEIIPGSPDAKRITLQERQYR